MKNALLKKSIFVITVILTIVGVSLFAYWMSDILAPDDVEEDIVVVIGVGDATGTNLKVQEAVQELGLTFVPATRKPEDIIDETYVTEEVFEVKISWQYEVVNENERGVLAVSLSEFIFYEGSISNPSTVQLNPAQQTLLKEAFEVELVRKNLVDDWVVEDPYLIEADAAEHWQPIFIRLKFVEDVVDKETWELLRDKIYELKILIVVEKTVKI
jgi:hypothetical protein